MHSQVELQQKHHNLDQCHTLYTRMRIKQKNVTLVHAVIQYNYSLNAIIKSNKETPFYWRPICYFYQ